MAHEESLIALVVALYKEGKTIGTIRKQTGVCRQTIYNWLRKAGENPDRYQTSIGDNIDHKLKKYANYLIDRAVAKGQNAEEVLRDFSKYVRQGIAKKTIKLTAKDAEQFVEACLNPREPSEAAIVAAKRYAETALAKDLLDEPKQPRVSLADHMNRPLPEGLEETPEGYIRTKESPVRRDPIVKWGEETLKDGALEAGFKASHDTLTKDPEAAEKYKQYFTEVPNSRPAFTGGGAKEFVEYNKQVGGSEITEEQAQEFIDEAELYDIEAEDAKKICTMCGNLMDTEFCCKWEG